MINLPSFFKAFESEIYCIIKADYSLPNYKPNSDIDIFCFDVVKFSQIILALGNEYIKEGYEIKIDNISENSQIHLDFIINNKIDLRFDLYSKFPTYLKVNIKPALFECILENRITKNLINTNSEEIKIYVPCLIDETILRYIEYHEWYAERPDKIKHIDYILNNTLETDRETLLSKLHHYTELPRIYSEKKVIEKVSLLKKIINLRKRHPKDILAMVKNKLKQTLNK